jgi:hypothetical protein
MDAARDCHFFGQFPSKGKVETYQDTVFRIQSHRVPIRIQHVRLTPDPDPKIVIMYSSTKKFNIFFDQKL